MNRCRYCNEHLQFERLRAAHERECSENKLDAIAKAIQEKIAKGEW